MPRPKKALSADTTIAPAPKKRGRPFGSKNKKKVGGKQAEKRPTKAQAEDLEAERRRNRLAKRESRARLKAAAEKDRAMAKKGQGKANPKKKAKVLKIQLSDTDRVENTMRGLLHFQKYLEQLHEALTEITHQAHEEYAMLDTQCMERGIEVLDVVSCSDEECGEEIVISPSDVARNLADVLERACEDVGGVLKMGTHGIGMLMGYAMHTHGMEPRLFAPIEGSVEKDSGTDAAI